ncbi:MAG: flippase activity-associated protein Agl23 [Thermoguttaceae bacterium]
MRARTWSLIFLLVVAAIAAGFRLPDLARRPMHADESVQVAIFRDLWLQGRYAYNPNEFHGPTLPYATLPSAWLGGTGSFAETTEVTYRIVPASFGIGLVLLVACLGGALGRGAARSAALLAAVSPAMVFYSRYYIHETLLAFFTLAAIVLAWRYLRSGRLAWCLTAGAAIGLMQTTKETAPLSGLAALAAAGLAWLFSGIGRKNSSEEAADLGADQPGAPKQLPLKFHRSHLVLAALAALLVAAAFYSSFFTHPRGLVDAALAYEPWLRRAGGGSAHANPWHFFLHRLAWWRLKQGPVYSELLIVLLAACGWLAAWLPKGRLLDGADPRFLRWLGFYTLLLAAAYAAIPYKTPWCVLQFLLPMILLAGVGAVAVVRATPTIALRAIVVLALLAAAGQLGWQSHRASFIQPADPENPWVFAQTSPGLVDLAHIVDQFAQAHPQGHDLPIKIVWNDPYYWPLPWYLRQFRHVEPWTSLPPDPAAAVVISSPRFDRPLTAALEQTHLMTGYYEIRPQVLAQLWVREDVWEAHLRRLGRL